MAFFHSFVNDMLTNPFYSETLSSGNNALVDAHAPQMPRTSSTATDNIRRVAHLMDTMVIESNSMATFSFPRIVSSSSRPLLNKSLKKPPTKLVTQEKGGEEYIRAANGREEDENWRNSLRRSSITYSSSRPPFNFPAIRDQLQPMQSIPARTKRVAVSSKTGDSSNREPSNAKTTLGRRKIQSNKSSQRPKPSDNSHNEKLIAKITYELGCERYLVEMIEREVLQRKPNIVWKSIAGLKEAKSLLQEAVVLPNIVPDFFKGIRRPWKGVLLVGPPGTGKTLLAKAVATECKSTFFNVTSSTLTSKFRGESEKLVRILFHMARCMAPSIIFIDEVDCLVGRRNAAHDHDASRRFQAEFLIQMDGLQEATNEEDKSILVLAASNHPWMVDEAFRRRFEKRIYIPLPNESAREEMLKLHLTGMKLDSRLNMQKIAKKLDGYSGADILSVCRDGAMMSLRRKIANKSTDEIHQLTKEDLEEPITGQDLHDAIKRCKTSVSPSDINKYDTWMKEFGSY